MLLNHLFQWLLCFQRCSPPQSPPATIHSPSTADPLKGLCGLQMQIKSSGAYQLYSKKKRKINHFWGCLANKWLKRRQIKGILWSRGGRPKLTRMRLASLAILINFRKQLQLWIDNWTVFCVCFWLVVLWMSLCRKVVGEGAWLHWKVCQCSDSTYKMLPFPLLKSNSHHLCSSLTSLGLSWCRDIHRLGTLLSWMQLSVALAPLRNKVKLNHKRSDSDAAW